MTILFLPTAEAAISAVSTQQYHLTGSDGSSWQAIDPFFKLTLSFTPIVTCQVFLGANADLWTANPGYNQDIGIAVTDQPLFPTTPMQPEGWKESGGFAGTFSPNAAFEQTVITLTGGTTYTLQLVWKTNISAPGKTIYAGAGPLAGKFSPTSLTLQPIACYPPV